MGEPTKEERKLIDRRIRAVSAFKSAIGGAVIPTWLDIDEIAPGTLNVGTGVPDKDLAGYDRDRRERWVEKRRARNLGQWTDTTRVSRRRILLAYKEKSGGIIGLSLSRTLSVKVSYDSIDQGYFPTYAEAAEHYDALAVRYEGDDAVLNDPDAVKKQDRKLIRLKLVRANEGPRERRMAR
jgi:hypothetical protein